MQPEAKFYKELKKNIPHILWNRLENLSLLGMPDLLGYNKKQCFLLYPSKSGIPKRLKFSSLFHKIWGIFFFNSL